MAGGYDITGVTTSQGGQGGRRVAAGMDSAVTGRLLLSAAPRVQDSRRSAFGAAVLQLFLFPNPLLIQWARIQDP